jgi:MFS family permease
VFRATRLILSIFAPLAAGFLIIKFGFDVLFIIAIVLFIISGIPYLTIPHTKEKFSWSLKRTYQELFSKNKRKIIIAYVADGSENVVGLVIWPIFIYQLLNGDYFQVGAISTFIIAMTVVLQLALGKHIDLKKSQGKILKWGSVFYSLGWLIKIFIVTAFQIFLAGAYHSIARIFLRTPFELLTYEIAADQGHYVDEFTVLHEMAMNFGKVMTILLVIMMSPYFSIQWIFLVAAVATLVFNLLNVERREKKLIYS